MISDVENVTVVTVTDGITLALKSLVTLVVVHKVNTEIHLSMSSKNQG